MGSSPILEASTSLICCWMVPKALLVHRAPELSPGRQALRQHPNRPHRLLRAHRHRLILRAIHDVDAENRAQGISMTLASTCPRASGARFWHGSGAPASPSSSSGPHPKRAYKQTFCGLRLSVRFTPRSRRHGWPLGMSGSDPFRTFDCCVPSADEPKTYRPFRSLALLSRSELW